MKVLLYEVPDQKISLSEEATFQTTCCCSNCAFQSKMHAHSRPLIGLRSSFKASVSEDHQV